MPISIANLNSTSDTFQSWVDKTNQIADALSTVVVTSAANSIGGQNSANVYLNGILSANVIVAGESLRGGSILSSSNLAITSNVNFTGANLSANVTYLTMASTLGKLTTTTLTLEGNNIVVTSNINLKSNSLSVVQTGRVGINTTTTDAALTVSGSANVSQQLTVAGNTVLVANTLAQGNVTVALAGLDTTGYIFFGNTSNRSLGYDGTSYTFTTANVVVQGTLIANAITAAANITMGTGAIFVGNVAGTSNTCARSITIVPNNSAAANALALVTGAGTLTGDLSINVYSSSSSTANTIVARDASQNFSANTITATTFTGTANQATYLFYNSGYRSATDGNIANSIMARDGGGNTSAAYFNGTATTARYADLAENYLADATYPVGTVVIVGGTEEITQCTSGTRALGVVSEKPAYLMNRELVGGTAIALKGRVPVRVVGPVTKGEGLVSGEFGTAVSADALAVGVFALALESSVDLNEKMVEAIIL